MIFSSSYKEILSSGLRVFEFSMIHVKVLKYKLSHNALNTARWNVGKEIPKGIGIHMLDTNTQTYYV